MLVFTLKRIDPIMEYVRPSSFHPPRSYCVLSQRMSSVSRTASISRQIFCTFRLTIVLEGISNNWTWQEAEHWRRLPSSFHQKLRLRSNKPTRNFPPPHATL